MKYLLILLLVVGCGTRKVETDVRKANTKEQTETKVEAKNDIITNAVIHKTATRKVIESVDPNKPSTYNGKTFQNAKIVEEEVTEDAKVGEVDKSKRTEEVKTESKTSTKEKTKDVKSERANPWLWVMLGVVVLGIIYWRPWRN